MVLPHFDYDVLYDAMPKNSAGHLEILQNKCLRICLKCEPRTKVTDMLAEAKVITLKDRRINHTCGIVHKGLTNMSTPGVNSMFTYCHESAQQDTHGMSNYRVKLPTYKLKL